MIHSFSLSPVAGDKGFGALTVRAPAAFTSIRAIHSHLEALAVTLATAGFLAGAALAMGLTLRSVLHLGFESVRIPLFNFNSRADHLLLVASVVPAPVTAAVGAATGTVCEAFAV